VSLRRLRAIARKEWIQIRREPRTLAIAFAMPVVLLLLYGYGLNLDLKNLRVALYDQDQSSSSRAMLDALTHTGYFTVCEVLTSAPQIEDVMLRGRCQAVLVIPPSMQRNLASGSTVSVQIILDGTDATMSNIARGYFEAALQGVSSRWAHDTVHRQNLPRMLIDSPIDLQVRFLYNPGLSSTEFIVPGLIAIILSILAALLTSGTIVRERERGTFEALASSPVHPGEIMVGKVAPYVAIAFGDVLLALAAGRVLFGVVPQGNLVQLFALSTLFVMGVLSIGLLVSTIASSQLVASVVAFVSTVLPTFMLSGFVFPIRNMPVALQVVAQLLPTTHFLTIVRSLVIKGVGIEYLWRPTLALALFSLVAMAGATRQFRKTL